MRAARLQRGPRLSGTVQLDASVKLPNRCDQQTQWWLGSVSPVTTSGQPSSCLGSKFQLRRLHCCPIDPQHHHMRVMSSIHMQMCSISKPGCIRGLLNAILHIGCSYLVMHSRYVMLGTCCESHTSIESKNIVRKECHTLRNAFKVCARHVKPSNNHVRRDRLSFH